MLSEEIICVLCREHVINNLVRCPCGHMLCSFCFDDFSQYDSGKFSCVECGKDNLVNECLEDYKFMTKLRKVSFQCNPSGYSTEGSSKDYRDYNEVCEFAHLAQCSYRQYGCLERRNPNRIKYHEESCHFKPKKHEKQKKSVQDQDYEDSCQFKLKKHEKRKNSVQDQDYEDSCQFKLKKHEKRKNSVQDQGHEESCQFKPIKHEKRKNSVQDQGVYARDKKPEYIPHRYSLRESPRMEMDRHLQPVHSDMQCEFYEDGCLYEGDEMSIENHYRTDTAHHLNLVKESLKKVKVYVDSNFMDLSQKILDLQSDISDIHSDVSAEVGPVVTAVKNVVSDMLEMRGLIEKSLSKLEKPSLNRDEATFIWKVTEAEKFMQEAETGRIPVMYSSAFLTSKYGYRVCLKLSISRDKDGRNTSLSVFLVIMKGEYDAILHWPFTYEVSITLLSQDGGHNITKILLPTSPTTQKSKSKANTVCGCENLAPLSLLYGSMYLKNDTMFIRCDVETSNLNSP